MVGQPDMCGDERETAARMRDAGLRPTRQRTGLSSLLFAGGDRHVTAEALLGEARAAGISVSLATVYNTLNQFRQAGLLREVAIDAAQTYYDTNVGDHHHFYVEDRSELTDIPQGHIRVEGIPPVPDDLEIDRIDVIVRLRPRAL